MNPYELLNLPRDATADDIRKAYRRLAKAAHPDHGGDPRAWEKLQLAYTVLIDPDARARYDATGDITLGQPNNALGEVIGIISVAMENVLARSQQQQMPLDGINLLAALRQQMRADMHNRHAELADLKDTVDGLRGRFVRRHDLPEMADSPDVMALLVTHFEKMHVSMMARCEAFDRATERAIKELDLYVDMLAMRIEHHEPEPAPGIYPGWDIFAGLRRPT